jgi:F-type H+-transporting ATPase subunit delta
VRVSPVTARWAGALFELASEKNVLDQVERDVEFLAGELSVDSVSQHLFDARVALETKRGRIELLKPHLQELTYNFLCLLLDRRRLEVLRELHDAFRAQVLERRGAVEGVVESPRPLDAADLAKLQTALQAKLGKTVTLEARIVPELVAGVRVFVDNKLIDQSAVGRLEGLRERMLAARL